MEKKLLPALQLHFAPQQWRHVQTTYCFWLWWFGLSRWFVRAVSCEWGGSLSSSNDRGSWTPPLCTCRATGWTVRWVAAASSSSPWHQPYPPPYIFSSFPVFESLCFYIACHFPLSFSPQSISFTPELQPLMYVSVKWLITAPNYLWSVPGPRPPSDPHGRFSDLGHPLPSRPGAYDTSCYKAAKRAAFII